MREGGDHPPQQNPLPEGRDGAGAPPGKSGAASQGSSDDEEMVEDNSEDDNDNKDPKMSGEEDPVNGQTGKESTPKTMKGEEMERMFNSFCGLSKSNVNNKVVFFGVSMMDNLANFREEHWKDTFVKC